MAMRMRGGGEFAQLRVGEERRLREESSDDGREEAGRDREDRWEPGSEQA